MNSIENTDFYSDVIRKLSYPFGNVFVFKEFIVSELNEGIIFSWEHQGRVIAEDVTELLDTNGSDLVYISNRIHSYSVIPSDWTKFYKTRYTLKAYCVVSQSRIGVMNSKIENLFYKNEVKQFNTIYEAVNWAKNDLTEITR